VSLVTAAAVAAETADVRETDVAPPPEEASTHDDHAEAEAEAEAPAAPAAALPPDVPAAAPPLQTRRLKRRPRLLHRPTRSTRR
jgi:hypothetical protein